MVEQFNDKVPALLHYKKFLDLLAHAYFHAQAKAKGFTSEQAHAVTVSKHAWKDSLQGELFDVVMVSVTPCKLRTCHLYKLFSAITPSKVVSLRVSTGLLNYVSMFEQSPF